MKTFPMRTNKNLIVAETFLDMFGLTFDRDDTLRNGDLTPIINGSNEVVGEMKYAFNTVSIDVNTPLGPMSATFPDIHLHTFSVDLQTIYFIGTVSYKIFLEKNRTLHGRSKFYFTKYDYGNLVVRVCHGLNLLNNNCLETSITVGDEIFKIKFEDEQTNEEIFLNLDFAFANCFVHNIRNDSPSARTAAHRSIRDSDKDKNKLRIFCSTSVDRVLQEEKEEFVDKVSKNEKKSTQDNASIIQLGSIIQKVDPEFKEKLAILRNSLNNGSTNLLDEILNTSLKGFTDNELEALFGFIPKLEREPEKRYTFLPIKK